MSFGVQNNVRFTMRLASSPGAVHGGGITDIALLTQADYTALATKSSTTVYLVQQTGGSIKIFVGTAELWSDPTIVHSDDIDTIDALTQAEYDAITTKDAETLYVIRETSAAAS